MRSGQHMIFQKSETHVIFGMILHIQAMVNTHYMVDGHPIHNKDPYNGYYKPL